MNVLWVTGDDCGAQPPGQQCHARVDNVTGTGQPTQGASGLCLGEVEGSHLQAAAPDQAGQAHLAAAIAPNLGDHPSWDVKHPVMLDCQLH